MTFMLKHPCELCGEQFVGRIHKRFCSPCVEKRRKKQMEVYNSRSYKMKREMVWEEPHA